MDTDHKAHKRSQLDFISPPVLCVTIQLEQGLVSAVRSIGPLPASGCRYLSIWETTRYYMGSPLGLAEYLLNVLGEGNGLLDRLSNIICVVPSD